MEDASLENPAVSSDTDKQRPTTQEQPTRKTTTQKKQKKGCQRKKASARLEKQSNEVHPGTSQSSHPVSGESIVSTSVMPDGATNVALPLEEDEEQDSTASTSAKLDGAMPRTLPLDEGENHHHSKDDNDMSADPSTLGTTSNG
ncbi:hypothetical protein BGX23_002728, partial [Mortierella sp. AD031]